MSQEKTDFLNTSDLIIITALKVYGNLVIFCFKIIIVQWQISANL